MDIPHDAGRRDPTPLRIVNYPCRMNRLPFFAATSEKHPSPGSLADEALHDVLPALERVCTLTARFFDVPMVAVTWLAGQQAEVICALGLDESTELTFANLSREASSAAGVFIAGDTATAQPASPGKSPGFIAVAPLYLLDGDRVGALCIGGPAPRSFDSDDARRLTEFAAIIGDTLRAHKALRDAFRREALIARASRLARVGGWECDIKSGALRLSEQVFEIFGISPARTLTLDQLMRRFYQGEALIEGREDFTRLVREGKPYEARRRIQRLDGTTRWIHVLAEPEVRDGEVVHVFGIVEDITDEVESQSRFHDLAYTDKLTGLPNRGAFLQALQTHCARGDPVVLIAIDVDGFKDVNDTMGHYAGDQLLVEVGQRITAFFPVNTFVARVGSNEFTVIATNRADDLEGITAEAEQLRLALKEPLRQAETSLIISASIGLCAAPLQAGDADQLVRSTDIALYQAKRSGGDRTVVFEPEMRNRLEERVQLLRDVRAGIEREEFVLYYQPIYDMVRRRLSGFEALMRWSRPEKGIWSPSEFAAAFNDQILAPMLGDVALHTACAQMRTWLDTGFDFGRVAVNIAAAQFYPGDLASYILSLLASYGLTPRHLTLEITESVYLGAGADVVEDALRQLHNAGVRIALDDFGTGFASLSQLQRFPIDSLKIDKSFVQNPGAQSIVDASIALGRSLNMDVVAEGVETAAHQQERLRCGCRFGQGFFFGKPMPAAFYD